MDLKEDANVNDGKVAEKPPTLMERQPVITVIAVTTAVSAFVKALVAFGLDVSPEQESAVNGAIVAAWPVVTAFWLWFKVYAPATVQKIKEGVIEG